MATAKKKPVKKSPRKKPVLPAKKSQEQSSVELLAVSVGAVADAIRYATDQQMAARSRELDRVSKLFSEMTAKLLGEKKRDIFGN